MCTCVTCPLFCVTRWSPGDEELEQASLAVQLVSRLAGTQELETSRAYALASPVLKLWAVFCGEDARSPSPLVRSLAERGVSGVAGQDGDAGVDGNGECRQHARCMLCVAHQH